MMKVKIPWATFIWIQLNIASISWLVYCKYFEHSYLSYPDAKFEIVNAEVNSDGVKTVRYGELLHLKFTRCNDDDIPHTYTIGRNMIIEGERKILEPGERMIDPGCLPVDRWVPLPPDTPSSGTKIPGPMYGFAQTIGTLKNHIVRWKSEDFIVLPAASAASK